MHYSVVFCDVSHTDTWNTFPILVLLLYPTWYIFMTSSIYMTVAVAVNRCLEMRKVGGKKPPRFLRFFHNSGVAQSLAVFLWANIFIFPRWFDYKIVDVVNKWNVTLEDSITTVEVNETVAGIDYTWLRKNKDYNRAYQGIMNPLFLVIIPLAVMVVSSILLLRHMRAMATVLSTSDQEKRNRSVTTMLIGIIVLFVICHMGKIIFFCYQLWGGIEVYEELWVKNLIIVNDTLGVVNSSLNFAIYCKDLLFRQATKKVYGNFLMCLMSKDNDASKSEFFVLSTTNKAETRTLGENSHCREAEPLQKRRERIK